MKSYPCTLDKGRGELLIFTGVTHAPDGDRAGADGVGVGQPGAGPPMHVHDLRDETARVVEGPPGYQILGQEAKFAEAGELVVWPAGQYRILSGCALRPSTKEHGGRPGLFDAAFLMTRYRSEYAMLEWSSRSLTSSAWRWGSMRNIATRPSRCSLDSRSAQSERRPQDPEGLCGSLRFCGSRALEQFSLLCYVVSDLSRTHSVRSKADTTYVWKLR